MKIFARRTLFPSRYFSIHVKMCVLLTYSGVKWVSAMSGASTFDIEKKQKRGEFNPLRAGGVIKNKHILLVRYIPFESFPTM